MDMHPKFATWLASANITPEDSILRKWWTGIDSFKAIPTDIPSLVQLANEADPDAVGASRFHGALQKQDAALLPTHKVAVAVLAVAKLHSIVEQKADQSDSLGDFAALLSAVSFPLFEEQPTYRRDLTTLAENSLKESSRARCNMQDLLNRLDEKIKEDESEEEEEEEDLRIGELQRVLAVTAEEVNILWWIFGGCSRDSQQAFSDIVEEVVPFVAAKELADLTTILPGHAAISAFADRACRTGRDKAPQPVVLTTAIKKLPKNFVTSISESWMGHPCLPVCRLSRQIVGQPPAWGKSHKLRAADLSQLFFRECLVPRAWQKLAS